MLTQGYSGYSHGVVWVLTWHSGAHKFPWFGRTGQEHSVEDQVGSGCRRDERDEVARRGYSSTHSRSVLGAIARSPQARGTRKIPLLATGQGRAALSRTGARVRTAGCVKRSQRNSLGGKAYIHPAQTKVAPAAAPATAIRSPVDRTPPTAAARPTTAMVPERFGQPREVLPGFADPPEAPRRRPRRLPRPRPRPPLALRPPRGRCLPWPPLEAALQPPRRQRRPRECPVVTARHRPAPPDPSGHRLRPKLHASPRQHSRRRQHPRRRHPCRRRHDCRRYRRRRRHHHSCHRRRRRRHHCRRPSRQQQRPATAGHAPRPSGAMRRRAVRRRPHLPPGRGSRRRCGGSARRRRGARR